MRMAIFAIGFSLVPLLVDAGHRLSALFLVILVVVGLWMDRPRTAGKEAKEQDDQN